MLKEGRYTLGELTSYLKESTGSEFNPKKGEKVDSENAKNNEKAVDDIMTDVKVHSGVKSPKRHTDAEDVNDHNKTTLDVRFDYDPGKAYKERVKAQVEGYPSAANKETTDAEESGAGFEGGEKFYKEREKVSKKLNDRHMEIKHAGLKARMFPEKEFENDTLFTQNESKAMKRLHFKNTQFLSESQMFDRVPEDYKTDGNVFIMRDATGTDYLIECRIDDEFGYAQLKVVNRMNKKTVNEELDRMRKLYGYASENESGSADDMNMSEMIREMREMGK